MRRSWTVGVMIFGCGLVYFESANGQPSPDDIEWTEYHPSQGPYLQGGIEFALADGEPSPFGSAPLEGKKFWWDPKWDARAPKIGDRLYGYSVDAPTQASQPTLPLLSSTLVISDIFPDSKDARFNQYVVELIDANGKKRGNPCGEPDPKDGNTVQTVYLVKGFYWTRTGFRIEDSMQQVFEGVLSRPRGLSARSSGAISRFALPTSNRVLTVACRTRGAIGKCMRITLGEVVSSDKCHRLAGAVGTCLRYPFHPYPSNSDPYHQACTRAMRGDYCGDGQTHTHQGVQITLELAYQPASDVSGTMEAYWSQEAAYCISHARYQKCEDALVPTAERPTCYLGAELVLGESIDWQAGCKLRTCLGDACRRIILRSRTKQIGSECPWGEPLDPTLLVDLLKRGHGGL